MNLYLSIALTLLAIVAGMYLLAKTRSESLGNFFKFISWLVVIVAILILLCQLTRGIRSMVCRIGICPPSENCMPEMMNHKNGFVNGMRGDCIRSDCREMENCCAAEHCRGMMHSHGKCCEEMEGAGECAHGMNKGCVKGEEKDSLKAK